MIKVCKFGGSSLADAVQYEKIKAIIESDDKRKIIVASACGKSNKQDHKVTDLLYLCLAHKKYGMSIEEIMELIYNKHKKIVDKLKLDFDLDYEINRLRKMLEKSKNEADIISFGEYLSSKLLALYLNCIFVDAKDIISFKYDGNIDMEETYKKFIPFLKAGKRIVVPGFYGSLPNGIIKLLSRGGSDITGAILANIVNAEVYENWTDVSGIYVCDPSIIKNPKQIKTITYSELREMSYMGANVLHEKAIYPVKIKNIPINIKNTNKPENKGTIIVNNIDIKEKRLPITGITGRKDFIVVNIIKTNSSSEIGFLKKTLDIFEHYKIPIVMVTTGIDSFSIIVDKEDIKNNIYELANEIKNNLNCEEVSVYDHLSLVCVVGIGMKERKGISGELFSLLGQNGINIRTISQGADEISILLGVNDDDYKKTIEVIYKRFIR